ncbi:hypothetical protein Stsp01_53500 [Streptomyces sp. NBRC 13847]|uniref:YncE family protein n=1 Tax=Streptomyces TaxID=1883 RepID=UPI00249FF33D|nr:hypothetical protein [Streptomyces sp. NBRC 13847]GLW18607.1 hypothetical protein Stsp01_53500 [Streptomyces sp. NBRC 13847]
MNTDVPRQLTPEDPTPPVNPRIPADTGPFAMATEPSGKLYIANTGSNDVSVIDSSDNTVTTTVPAGTGPSAVAVAVAVAPNGNVYVTNFASNDVSVFLATATHAAGVAPPADGDSEQQAP